MLDEIFLPERAIEDPLTQQVWQRVLDKLRYAALRETDRQSLNPFQLPIGNGKQRHATIRRDCNAVEGTHKFAST